MYDELIKRLRECTAEQNGEKTLWHQAADAIELLVLQLAFRDETAKLVAQKLPKWIPVTERLPDNHEYVLCCGSKGGMFVGWVGSCNYGRAKAMGFVHGGHGRYLTHWMPLPQPPESEG
jgi:hypothetical protein